MSERFFVDHPIDSNSVEIQGQEATHILKVMRLGVGDPLTVFDGSGKDFAGQILDASRGRVAIEIHSEHTVDRELRFDLSVASTLPKGDRQRFLVEKLTELGVTRWIPLTAKRSSVKPNSRSTDRLRRTVIEASKQCGRSKLMEISEPQSLANILQQDEPGQWRLFCTTRDPDRSASDCRHERVLILIGPEGGWTSDEQNLAVERGCQLISLGQRILRTETAAICASAQVIGTARPSPDDPG